MVLLGPSPQRLQEECYSTWWPWGTGGHTATPGVFLKPKDSEREEGELERFLQLMQNKANPSSTVTSQGDDRRGENRLSTFLLGQQEDKSLYFLRL